ncbi:Abi family protein [Paenibacillus polygoni]|uniref:Abi family protein n=1 Tax=Paenibacillus polygoni TaxID=3050112 RepID=A0ABY8X1H7_9BACL|nr:Abi family protein [Paenibacillus polygoni]WIV19009.1 Abi family protein [Paenibacillus polygoni]
MSQVKTVNQLMQYLRNTHKINISGGPQKRRLRNIGYYHGFKGYRYISTPGNQVRQIHYSDFNEILAVNDLDMNLKSIFYRHIMFIETALKNYVLEVVLDQSKTSSFNEIFDTVLTYYKTYQSGSEQYRKALSKRLVLREKFYGTLTRNFNTKKDVIQHFYVNDQNVPIWAIFEVITIGEFGNFVSVANLNAKNAISRSLGLNQAFDSNGKLTESIIYQIKDLRNSIAHNDVIFDARFRSSTPNRALIQSLERDTSIRNITFNTIVDYFILVIYLLKSFKLTKTELMKTMNRFESAIDDAKSQIPQTIYNQIFLPDTKHKLSTLRQFI